MPITLSVEPFCASGDATIRTRALRASKQIASQRENHLEGEIGANKKKRSALTEEKTKLEKQIVKLRLDAVQAGAMRKGAPLLERQNHGVIMDCRLLEAYNRISRLFIEQMTPPS